MLQAFLLFYSEIHSFSSSIWAIMKPFYFMMEEPFLMVAILLMPLNLWDGRFSSFLFFPMLSYYHVFVMRNT